MNNSQTATAPWTKTCYGIDISSDEICVVHAVRRGRRVDCSEVEFDQDEIKKEVEKGAAVAASVPVSQTISTWVTAPFASASKSKRVFPTLLDIKLPFQLDECVYEFVDTRPSAELPGSGTGTSSLAVAARRQDIESCLKSIAGHGIDPHILDHEGIALWTQFILEHNIKSEELNNLKALVFLKGDSGTLVIGVGKTFLSCHRIDPHKPEILERYLRAQANRMPNAKSALASTDWYWAGSGFEPGGTGSKLLQYAEQQSGHGTMLNDPKTFLARALATRVLLPGPMRVNLRQGSYFHSGAHRKILRQHMTATTMVFISGLVMCVAALAWNQQLKIRQAKIDDVFSRRINKVLGYKLKAKGRQALIVATRDIEKRQEDQSMLAQMFNPSLLNEVAHITASAKKHNIKISRMAVSDDGSSLSASGDTKADLKAFATEVFAPDTYKGKVKISENGNKFVVTAEVVRR